MSPSVRKHTFGYVCPVKTLISLHIRTVCIGLDKSGYQVKKKSYFSTHNLCYHWEIRKNIDIFWLKKSALSKGMVCQIISECSLGTQGSQISSDEQWRLIRLPNIVWSVISMGAHFQKNIFTLSIQTLQLLSILVLKFEQVQFTSRCCV